MSRSLFIFVFALSLASCGEPTDRPEDCTPSEFFDESVSLCRVCPAAREPTCDTGCGFEIVTGERGCPVAECLVGPTCNRCEPTEWVDPETLICEPCDGPASCPDETDPERWIIDGGCTLQCG